MHDVALEVGEKEICTLSSISSELGKSVRHVSLMKRPNLNYCFTKSHIRTYKICGNKGCEETPTDKVLANYKCLRALDLNLGFNESLSRSIGKLIHLRYLDLSDNWSIKVLPKSITKLFYLQTLNLKGCFGLMELPNDLSNLVNLIVLTLTRCNRLKFMPLGMGRLTNLCKLSTFVVSKRNSSLKQYGELEDLKALKKLRGSITIKIHSCKTGAFVKDDNIREGAYMRDKEHLDKIKIECEHEDRNEGYADYEEELVGSLQPHVNVKELKLKGYSSVKMPKWAEEDNLATFLPNLVRLYLYGCTGLRCLASLGKLYHLKDLTLRYLHNLEYVESQPTIVAVLGRSNDEGLLFLPSLENLTLEELPKLKEWCRRSGDKFGGNIGTCSSQEPHQSSLFLSQLKMLSIRYCPKLTSLPDFPNVETLRLFSFSERLQIITNRSSCPKLRNVDIGRLSWLQSFQSLPCLKLLRDKVESLTDFGHVFRGCSTSLQTLRIIDCPNIRNLSEGLGCLAALERLYLRSLPRVNFAKEENVGDGDGDGMPWGSLCHTLLHLEVTDCRKVKSMPKWMRKLTALQVLEVRECSKEVYERCQNPNGEDWPNIQHIPHALVEVKPEESWLDW